MLELYIQLFQSKQNSLKWTFNKSYLLKNCDMKASWHQEWGNRASIPSSPAKSLLLMRHTQPRHQAPIWSSGPVNTRHLLRWSTEAKQFNPDDHNKRRAMEAISSPRSYCHVHLKHPKVPFSMSYWEWNTNCIGTASDAKTTTCLKAKNKNISASACLRGSVQQKILFFA